jgi:response regulator RpfG family c-di-GMP phosphodiesterase
MKKGKGRHFDPDLLDTFISMKEEILSIKKEYKNEDQSWLSSTVKQYILH